MLWKHVWDETHAWARKGDKKTRAEKRKMMLAFAAHAGISGARTSAQVGQTTVINFWKFQRIEEKLSWTTQMKYWEAIRDLWLILGKAGEPPRPRDPKQQSFKN